MAGRPKKNRKTAGRKPGAYSKLSSEGKRHYHYNKQRVSRGQHPVAVHEVCSPGPAGPDGDGPSSQANPEGGRPPLDKIKGRMNDEQLKERRRFLSRQYYETQKLSQIRRQAVSMRGDRNSEDRSSSARENESEEEEPNDENQVVSPATFKRLKSSFLKLLPVSLFDQLLVLRRVVVDLDVKALVVADLPPGLSGENNRSMIYQYRYRIKDFLNIKKEKHGVDPVKFLMMWAQNLITKDKENFLRFGVTFKDSEDIPVDVRIEEISDTVASSLIRERNNPDCRKVSIIHAVEVAQQAGLGNHHGDVAALRRGIGCSKEFSTKVLEAVVAKKPVESIVGRKPRKDATRLSGVSERLTVFLSNPEHTRALPGHNTVSVAYGCRKQKFLLKKSKDELLTVFKEENPDVSISKKVLLRDWPANFVPPTSKDEERNVCPLHSNFRRCLDGLRKVGAATNLPKSVRAICAMCLCDSPDTLHLDPSSWPQACALATCTSCPELHIELPANSSMMIQFLQWQKGQSAKLDRSGSSKEIFSLFPVTVTVSEAAKMLQSFFPKIKIHVYVATHQYEALRLRSNNLLLGDLLTIEDYTMNIELNYSETTTSSNYTANSLSFAGFPIAARFIDPDTLKPAKAAILFVSEDKKHDYEQVEMFEKRALEILNDKCGQFFVNWNRWSDNCAGQFKSRKTMGKLVAAKSNVLQAVTDTECKVSWEFLEANEAKNESDTIGGFCKTALRQVMLRNPDIAIHSADDLVAAIEKGLEKSCHGSARYKFIYLESFPKFDRKEHSAEIKLQGIQKLHSFTLHTGGIQASQLSCHECLVSRLCGGCKIKDATVSAATVEKALKDATVDDDLEGSVGESDEIGDLDVEDPESDSEDDAGSECKSSEDSCSDDDDEVDISEPGNIVWVLWGRRRYPARVVLVAEVPDSVRPSLRKDDGKSVVVRFYGDNDYSRVDKKKLIELGQDSNDLKWSRFSNVLEKYHLALADLKYG